MAAPTRSPTGLQGLHLSGRGQIDRSFAPETIKQFRQRFSLTQQDLARLLGVSKFTVFSYEQKGAPRWVRLALIGLADLHFGVPRSEVAWLGRVETPASAVRPTRVAEGPADPDPDEA